MITGHTLRTQAHSESEVGGQGRPGARVWSNDIAAHAIIRSLWDPSFADLSAGFQPESDRVYYKF